MNLIYAILIFISAFIVAVLDSIMEYVVIVRKKEQEAFILSVTDWFITALLFYFILRSEKLLFYLIFGSLGFGIGNFYTAKIISRWKKIKQKIKKILKKKFVKIA